jgi:signal transduction histidine kinase/ligand-binding sensor domain-containing protein/AraC-like DNA-binding protein
MMKYMKQRYRIILFFGLVFYELLQADTVRATESFHFEWLSDKDGLSQNTVRCIMQDSKGFIWFGTINGLNRYNGREFTVMRPESNQASFSDRRIRGMVEDRNGYIWIRSMSNTFSCYDPRTERFITYDPENKQYSFRTFRIFSDGDVWMWGTSDGCYRIRHQEGKLQLKFFDEAGIGNQPVSFVHEDSQHHIWLSARKGGIFRLENDSLTGFFPESYNHVQESDGYLFFINTHSILPFDMKRQKFEQPVSILGGQSISLNASMLLNNGLIMIASSGNEIFAFDSKSRKLVPSKTFFKGEEVVNAGFLTDNRENKWIYNRSGNLWRQMPDNHFEKISLIPPSVLSVIDDERYDVYHDSQDVIWITTYGNGLFAIDTRTQEIHHYTVDNSDLPTNYLLCVTEDKSGEIWVGTEFAGISKISRNNYPLKIIYPSPEKNNRSNAARVIYEDSRGRYWIGTRNGYLYIYDQFFNKIKSHQISGGLPFALTEDTLGNIWLGTRGNGLMMFPPSGNAPVRQYDLQKDLDNSSNNAVFDILRDSKNRIWAASFGGGLLYADLGSRKMTFQRINMHTVNQNMIRVIRQDRTGLIWIGTNEGVNVFDPDELIRDNNKYVNFHFNANDNRSVSGNEIKYIYEDSQGRIWLGVSGGGLNLLMRETPIEHSWFKHYTEKNGLSNEVIQTITEDSEGNIWVSTEGGSGISKFNPQTERFENFNFSNNKQTALFNEGSCWKNRRGELMFGSYSGIFIFDPAEIKNDTYTPPVVITGLKINGIDARPQQENLPLTQSITLSKNICLKYNQNSFDIEFAMFNFQLPDFNQYTYLLEGYEKQWNPVTRHNIAAYRNVPSGTYYFKVKGSNSFGVWTEDETVLEIEIRPPFWKSVWAYMLYFILIAIAIFITVKLVMKINRLHTAVEVERQLTEYKLRFFTNISHEFRTPLTIIRGAIDNLTAIENLPPLMAKSVNQMAKGSSRLLRLIDQLLEFRRLQNKGLELKVERTEAVGFFHDIYLTFKEMTEPKNIDLLFESNFPAWEMLLDKSKFDKIAYNLLSNAIKYTPDNGIILMRLDFSKQHDRMTLSVSDSGPGVPRDKHNFLFVRFARMDDKPGGMGVGLHLTAEMAAVHRGKAEYSDSELGGACFSVSVPLSEANYTSSEIMVSQVLSKNTAAVINVEKTDLTEKTDKYLKAYKLLVIDDEDDIREFIVDQLDSAFTVSAAKNGIEGREKAIQEQPNLIICDVMMPGMDGFEMTRRLKDDFLTSHIPVILLTAHSSEEHRLEGIQAGADSYITKPFSIQYLKTRIIKLIEQREKLHRKFQQEPDTVNHLITFTNKDKDFLGRLDALIEKNFQDPDFSINVFAQKIGIGRTTFYQKVKGITGHPPNEYLHIIRLKKAAELLATTRLNVSEVAYKVGINDPFYFSKCFKTQFGKTPSQFQKGK